MNFDSDSDSARFCKSVSRPIIQQNRKLTTRPSQAKTSAAVPNKWNATNAKHEAAEEKRDAPWRPAPTATIVVKMALRAPPRAPLVGHRQLKPQPDEGQEVLPVHDAASPSSAEPGCGFEPWPPARCRKSSSSEPPAESAHSEPCSTSFPLTMMLTCVQSRSTTSKTCDAIRNTVDPRETNPASKSRMTREVTASTPSNGSSRNSKSGLGSRGRHRQFLLHAAARTPA